MAIHINISMRIESLSEWSIGTMIMGNDEKLHRWKYEVKPDGLGDFIPAMGRLLYRDLRFRMASTSRLITNMRYRVQSIVIQEDMKSIIVTLVAVCMIAIGVASTQSKPAKQITFAKPFTPTDSFPYKDESKEVLPDVGMEPRPEIKSSQIGVKQRVAVKKQVKETTAVILHKDFEVVPPLKTIKAKTVKSKISGIADVQIAIANTVAMNGESTKDYKREKMFSSKADCIEALWVEYNKIPNVQYQVNILTSIGQFDFESGLQEDGTVSALASNTYNHFGIKKAVYSHRLKTYVEKDIAFSLPGLYANAGDDEYIGGVKINSRFAIFSSIPQCLKAHVAFLQRPHYGKYRKYAGTDLNDALKACDELYKAGYFTDKAAVAGLQSRIKTVHKILVTRGLI